MYSTSKTVLVSSIFTNALTKQKEQNKNRVLCSILFAFLEYIADKSEEDDAHAYYVVHDAILVRTELQSPFHPTFYS